MEKLPITLILSSWVLYEGINYNAFNFNLLTFAGWGDNFPVDLGPFFAKRASSLRYVGAPNGYK